MMLEGRVRAALKFLSNNSDISLLSLDETVEETSGKTVRDILNDKHPDPRPAHLEALLGDIDNDSFHPVIFSTLPVHPFGLLLFTLKGQLDPKDLMHLVGDDYVLPSGKSPKTCARP